jgi:uroporphyrinogen decarboxylase
MISNPPSIGFLTKNDGRGFFFCVCKRSPQISWGIFREFFNKWLRLIWRRMQSLCKAKIMFHSCGAIWELIPDLIDAGLDVLKPIPTDYPESGVRELKVEFGRSFVFWGGGARHPSHPAAQDSGEIEQLCARASAPS